MVKYVCNPKTGRVIKVDTRAGSTYESLRKSSRWKRKLARSPESSSKEKLKPCKSPKRKSSKRKSSKRKSSKRKSSKRKSSKRKSSKRKSSNRRSRTPVKCGRSEGWADKDLPDGTVKRGYGPKGHERTVMLRDCGKKCFLGHKETFPICTRGTCSYNQKGISAACVRARQMSSPRSKKVKNRTKTYYNRIAQRALDLRNAQLKSSRGGGDHREHPPESVDDSHERGTQRQRDWIRGSLGGGAPPEEGCLAQIKNIISYTTSEEGKKKWKEFQAKQIENKARIWNTEPFFIGTKWASHWPKDWEVKNSPSTTFRRDNPPYSDLKSKEKSDHVLKQPFVIAKSIRKRTKGYWLVCPEWVFTEGNVMALLEWATEGNEGNEGNEGEAVKHGAKDALFATLPKEVERFSKECCNKLGKLLQNFSRFRNVFQGDVESAKLKIGEKIKTIGDFDYTAQPGEFILFNPIKKIWEYQYTKHSDHKDHEIDSEGTWYNWQQQPVYDGFGKRISDPKMKPENLRRIAALLGESIPIFYLKKLPISFFIEKEPYSCRDEGIEFNIWKNRQRFPQREPRRPSGVAWEGNARRRRPPILGMARRRIWVSRGGLVDKTKSDHPLHEYDYPNNKQGS